MSTEKLNLIRNISMKIESDSLDLLRGKYIKVSEFDNGIYYDENFISPISKSAHNVNSKILIILQDWASYDFLISQDHTPEKIKYGIDLSLPTNKRLQLYLLNYFGINFHQTYAINLFPYIKLGNISASIPIHDYLYSIENFIEPFIKSFEANIVIAVGSTNYNILRRFKKISKINIKDTYLDPFKIGNSIVLGVPHTGGMGTANAGGEDKVKSIWKTLSDNYRELIQ